MVNKGAKVLDTCTTLMGLSDLASDGSPLFAEPMFLFGWALFNTSTYCMLIFWLSCVNYALRGEFPLLHRLLQDIFTYALFWLPKVCLCLKVASLLYFFVFFLLKVNGEEGRIVSLILYHVQQCRVFEQVKLQWRWIWLKGQAFTFKEKCCYFRKKNYKG